MTATKRRALRVRRTRRKGERMRKVGGGTRRKGVRKGCRTSVRKNKDSNYGGGPHLLERYNFEEQDNTDGTIKVNGTMQNKSNVLKKDIIFIFKYKQETNIFRIYYKRIRGWFSPAGYGKFTCTIDNMYKIINGQPNGAYKPEYNTNFKTFKNIKVSDEYKSTLKRWFWKTGCVHIYIKNVTASDVSRDVTFMNPYTDEQLSLSISNTIRGDAYVVVYQNTEYVTGDLPSNTINKAEPVEFSAVRPQPSSGVPSSQHTANDQESTQRFTAIETRISDIEARITAIERPLQNI